MVVIEVYKLMNAIFFQMVTPYGKSKDTKLSYSHPLSNIIITLKNKTVKYYVHCYLSVYSTSSSKKKKVYLVSNCHFNRQLF